MKKTFLSVGILIFIFILAKNVQAVVKVDNTDIAIQTKEKVQTANQGETAQVQTQAQTQVQTQTQAQNMENTQIQAQQQTSKQNEVVQIETREQEQVQNQDKAGDPIMQKNRSQVANAVQEMLQVVDRNGGIGQQVRVVAQAQNQNQEKIEASLKKVQTRSKFVKFLIGPNYSEINNAKQLLEQNKEQIQQLNQIKTQLVNKGDIKILEEQIKVLEQANLEIKNVLDETQKGFSLFGWMFKLFVK